MAKRDQTTAEMILTDARPAAPRFLLKTTQRVERRTYAPTLLLGPYLQSAWQSREVIASESTLHPNSAWVEKQADWFVDQTAGRDEKPEIVMHDKDTKFTKEFTVKLKSRGFIMAMCDGSVRVMNVSLDPLVHQRPGARAEGTPWMWGVCNGGPLVGVFRRNSRFCLASSVVKRFRLHL